MHYPCSPKDNTCPRSVHLIPPALYPQAEVGVGKPEVFPYDPLPLPGSFVLSLLPALKSGHLTGDSLLSHPSLKLAALGLCQGASGLLLSHLSGCQRAGRRSLSHTQISGQLTELGRLGSERSLSTKAVAQSLAGVYGLGRGGGGALPRRSGRRVSCRPAPLLWDGFLCSSMWRAAWLHLMPPFFQIVCTHECRGERVTPHLPGAGFLGSRMGPAGRECGERRESQEENYKASESTGKIKVRGK